MKTAYLLAALFLITPTVATTQEMSMEQILAISKIAGACGSMNQMINFQTQTKLEGGDKFVVRFWETESARLGNTLEQMSSQCDNALNIYDNLYKAATSKE